MSSFRHSLRFRILLLIVVVVLPLLAITVYSGLEQRKLAGENVRAEVLRLARLVSEHNTALLEGARQLLPAIAQSPQVTGGDQAGCNRYFSSLTQELPFYAGMFLADLQGAVQCYSYGELPSFQVADRPYFQTALKSKGLVIGAPVIDRATGKPVLPVAYPVRAGDGRLANVLVATLDFGWLTDLAPTIGLPPEAVVRITDTQGLVLARSREPERYVGTFLQEPELLATVLKLQGESTAELPGIDGVVRLYSFVPYQTTTGQIIYFSVGIPSSIIFAGADQILKRNLLILGAVGVLVLAWAWVSSEFVFLRPIRNLLHTTRRLSAGDLKARVKELQPQGELGELGAAFNYMAGSLQRREQDLLRAEIRYRRLVEQIPAIVYTARPDALGKPSFISPQVSKTLGFTPQEWLADPTIWSRQIHPEDCERVLAEIETSMTGLQPFQSEYRIYNREGKLIWIYDEALPVTDPTGRPVQYQGLMTDITNRKRAEEALTTYSAQLERSNRELQDFAYISSHDLQEPLRKILAFGDRLATRYSDTLGEEGVDYLRRMRDAAARMQTLINDLLTFSRITTRARPFVPVDLNAVAAAVISDLEDLIRRTGGQVEVGPLGIVEADETQMRQLLQNLIGNGLKFYRPDEPPRVHITMRPGPQPGSVQLVVADNGIGFHEKYLDRIFQPFQRLHERGVYEGSGIGLAICRKIVDRHNGSLTAQSAPGQGAKFLVTLPRRQPKIE